MVLPGKLERLAGDTLRQPDWKHPEKSLSNITITGAWLDTKFAVCASHVFSNIVGQLLKLRW
jgi:hypothetical protein